MLAIRKTEEVKGLIRNLVSGFPTMVKPVLGTCLFLLYNVASKEKDAAQFLLLDKSIGLLETVKGRWRDSMPVEEAEQMLSELEEVLHLIEEYSKNVEKK